jgi:hypothetical protein
MSDTDQQGLGFFAKTILVLLILLAAAGLLCYGVTVETIERLWRQLISRPNGPMAFRFVLQPLMAAVAAVHDGLKDRSAGRHPFLWTIASNPQERAGRLREGLTATARIILLGLVMDTIYQVLEFQRFYPVEAVIIAVLLAFVPYLLIRGPITRIAHLWHWSARRKLR